MSKLVLVALKIPYNDGLLTYRLTNNNLSNIIGIRVRVSYRNKILIGVIVKELADNITINYQIKDIESVVDEEVILSNNQLNLIEFCSKYYLCPFGQTLHLAISRELLYKKPKKIIEKKIKKEEFTLSPEQEEIANNIIGAKDDASFLLEGVTGSGKTLIYAKVAQDLLLKNKSVLFLVPEISLTTQLLNRLSSYLGVEILAMHSNIGPKKKLQTIISLLKKEVRVLVGARSAIFAPMPDLGLIVVDEEHDSSFKQEENPRYHARDMAIWRAKNEQAKVILGSATPSLESILNVQKNKLFYHELKNRYASLESLPKVRVIDLKERARDVEHRGKDLAVSDGQRMCILSNPLLSAMKETLEKKAQVLLFLNQRGFAKFGLCKDCGKLIECPNCSVNLVFYQQRNTLLCHQCGHVQRAKANCAHCEREITYFGLGTERLEEEVSLLFPDKIILRLDRDIVRSQKKLNDTLDAMHSGKAHILIGTQMLTKGHDFKNVGLVGVVCADTLLSLPDFRASEKAFQLFTQVAGRAGRGAFSGEAIIQSFNPTHPSIKWAQDHDVKNFTNEELSLRKKFGLPPFKRAALLRMEHKNEEVAKKLIEEAFLFLKTQNHLDILGPCASPIERINNRFRFQCLVLSKSIQELSKALSKLRENLKTVVDKNKARFIIDIDPQNMS